MSSIDRGAVLQQLDRLFSEGTLAGLGDGELLERFSRVGITRRSKPSSRMGRWCWACAGSSATRATSKTPSRRRS